MGKRWRIAVAIVGAFILCSWHLLRSHTDDPYPFLAGHRPIDVSVLPPGTWGPMEVRLYSWKRPWQDVAAAARHDLPAFKLVEDRQRRKQALPVTWMSKETYGNGLEGISADIVLDIGQGRCREGRGHEPNIDNDPEWVTVSVVSVLDDNWINTIRYTFFASRD